MPIYEYKCTRCKARVESLQKVNDPPPKYCPHCGGVLKKIVSSPAIHFKGAGFYITDYPKKGASEKEPKTKEKPTAEKPAEAKPEAKPESK